MITDIEEALQKYDNPKTAEAVWNECLREINAYGCYDLAHNILLRTQRADALDIKLTNLISNRQ